ncbi:MAG: N-acetylglucosamine kinase [Actinomycetota bacterium]
MSWCFLGIDGGASATKWSLVDDSGNQIVSGKSDPIDGHVFDPNSKARLLEFAREIKVKITETPAAIYAGIAGAAEDRLANTGIAAIFKEVFPDSRIEVEIDVALGYRAAFKNISGIYIYAGTGSIAVCLNKAGEIKTVGGWGYLLGDEGAGYWIGRRAIQELLLSIERGEKSELEALLKGRVATVNFESIKAFVYGQPRSAVAAIAHDLINLSQSRSAEKILDEASQYLVDLIKRTELASGLSGPPIVFGGGIAQPAMLERIERKLGRKIEIGTGDLAIAAARLALATS